LGRGRERREKGLQELTHSKPLAIDLYCGLGGWAEGFLAEGYDIVGFDIERHDYGTGGYPGQLVLQDVQTLHGKQFKNAAVIVASPPCQAYSYRAMPWKRAKALPPPDNTLFETCFRIQREACEAAGRYIPLIVENVRGAEKWVGSAGWHFGSFYLWGDIPALMPPVVKMSKVPGFRFDGNGSFQSAAVRGLKSPGAKLSEEGFNVRNARRFREAGIKNENGGKGGWFGSYAEQKARGTISPGRMHGSKSDSRKAASAQIAKIPFPLSRHIARCFAQQGQTV
jgi:hypothetical protein